MAWRTIEFSYLVPEGLDFQPMEEAIIDAIADMLPPGTVDWVASAGPRAEEHD